MKKYCSWQIGGPADWLVEPTAPSDVGKILQVCLEERIKVVVIGHATNLLFDDSGFRGVVVRFSGNLSRFTIKRDRVWAQAGIWVPKLARSAGLAGLSGLEHTVGIPGTLGGLIAMNGGSQRKSIGANVIRVDTVDLSGAIRPLSQTECRFGYRSSCFQESELFVLGAELRLDEGDVGVIRREMIDILRTRRQKFPRRLPQCGSVFASDPKLFESYGPPGRIIEELGFKGSRIGAAEVSSVHANFIVNRGGALAKDVMELVRRIRRRVHERTGQWIACEVRYVSEDGTICPLHEKL